MSYFDVRVDALSKSGIRFYPTQTDQARWGRDEDGPIRSCFESLEWMDVVWLIVVSVFEQATSSQ